LKRLPEYLASVPERVIRSAVGIASGLVHEAGEIAIPSAVRRTRLYRSLVDNTLRFLIEQVGQVEGVFPADSELPGDFLLRRTAGNGLEALGLLTLHVSPVWVLAALADVTGAGRQLVAEISKSLAEDGLLERGAVFESVDQMLEALERTSARMAEAVNTPPLNVRQLRKELEGIRDEARTMAMPPLDDVWSLWRALTAEAKAQGRPVWELSSLIGLSTVRVAATQTSQALLEHYRQTLIEIHRTGYLRYLARELSPYLAAAVRQFSPQRGTLTQRLLGRRSST
jgi:hypothetical protein